MERNEQEVNALAEVLEEIDRRERMIARIEGFTGIIDDAWSSFSTANLKRLYVRILYEAEANR